VTPIRAYVVRIYRQGRGGIDGVVEDVKTGRARPFHSIVELWDALRTTRRGGLRKDALPPAPPPEPTGAEPR
jgi:hypothetical protein